VIDLKEELWRLAFVIAMTRIGLLALQRNDEGAYLPPTAAVKADPEGTRKARRKYRKLWRQHLARSLREFGGAPKRRQKRMRWHGVYVNGKWKSVEDPFDGRMLEIRSCDVGRQPRKSARAERWKRVKECPELRKELLKVAAEFGLLDPKRSM
jgi:hypothetical protein